MPFLPTIKAGDDVLLQASVVAVGTTNAIVLVAIDLGLSHAGAQERLRVPLASLIPTSGRRRANALNLTKTKRFQP